MYKNNDSISSEKMFNKIIHDIRNMKLLNKDMINAIEKMPNENKMTIILTYNNVLEHINTILDDIK